MRCFIAESVEIAENRKEAISKAKAYLTRSGKKFARIYKFYKDKPLGEVWFGVGTENPQNLTNFVKVKLEE